MLDTVLSLLRASGVSAWEVSDVTTDGWEFYFIRHALDQNRAKHVEHIRVKVYQRSEDGTSMGFAACEIPPTATESEAEKLIDALRYRASLVKNRPYTLQGSRAAEPAEEQTIDVAAISRAFLETMRDLPETPGEDINSYEIFVSEKHRRFINSEGIDVEESYPDSMIEVVVNARDEKREIELYRSFSSGTCDAAALKRDLLRAMQTGRDRLRALPTPPLDRADVLFTTADACEIYSCFAQRLDAELIYRGISTWKAGESICRAFAGDAPTLCAVRTLENSSANRRYDAEGAPVRDVVMMENGVVRRNLGSRMFSSYLGLEDSFIPTNFTVSGGSRSEKELRSGPYLEVVEFSDFQVDAVTGDLFGEIRLAYLHDGEKTVPVSGGSVSGNLLNLAENMLLSKETVQHDNWSIPSATLLKGVTVTGIE